jgi:hypothetical protein
MKKITLWTLLAVSCLSSCLDESVIPDGIIEEEPASEADTTGWGTSRHPMLFMDSIREEALRQAILTSHRTVWNHVLKETDDNMERKNPPAYNSNDKEQLWQRTVGANIAQLSFAARLTGEQRYYDAAKKWALACCAYPTWGTDDTPDGAEYSLAGGHQLFGLAMAYDYGQHNIDTESLAVIRETLISRTGRAYRAFSEAACPYLQNQTWIIATGMLASALVLQSECEDAKAWIAFAGGIFKTTSFMLSPDGVSQEGLGYWQYGMEWLMLGFDLMKNVLGINYYKENVYWQNTAAYATSMMTSRNSRTPDNELIDFADCQRYSKGSEPYLHRLADLNRDPLAQWYAEDIASYNPCLSWINIIWYNPAVRTKSNYDSPAFRHFENMGLVVSRTDFEGDESMLVFKCGAPLGNHAMNSYPDLLSGADVGHVHPDANHFIIYANGEYILKNNGYVRRITMYHNTLMVDNTGVWGDMGSYFAPWPLDISKNPVIREAHSEGNVDCITGDASNAYPDAVQLKTFIRRMIYIKDAGMIIVYDRLESALSHGYNLLFFPESDALQAVSGAIIAGRTSKNAVRIENLTPAISSMALTVETIRDRSNPVKVTTTPLVRISTNIVRSAEQVTAISWNKFDLEPETASLSEMNGKKVVTVKGRSYEL